MPIHLACVVMVVAGVPAEAVRAEEAREAPAFRALRKLTRPPVPAVRREGGVSNPIDAFILSKLEELGLSCAPPAEPAAFIRRATFDLLGLPPKPERVQAFVEDASPDAVRSLIDELLESPHYGERWGRHWLDVARYADSGGYETDIYYRHAWRYRDYVVRAFNEDRPYDRFVEEQIAADELWPDNLDLPGSYQIASEKLEHREALLGTGLYALGPQIHESNMDADRLAHERLTDWVDTTSSVFLGLTIGCARCHDHKFDPITQRDYYRMQAIFAPSREVEVPLVHAMGIADFRQHYPKLIAVDEARRAYRLFEQRVAGRTLTGAEEKEKARRLERLARSVLALPEADAQGERYDALMQVPCASVLGHERPELVQPVHRLARGELYRPLEAVSPGLPEALALATGWSGGFENPRGMRKQLARWLTRPDHPLTARVMVNRIWQWHFGSGLVRTPNDFGNMGEAPTHPELLDWLATEFVARRWSIKEMHRLIMTSTTYRRSSRFSSPEHLAIDPDNRLLWRMSRRRLEGEALWDAMHAASGTLNLAVGGRPVVPPLASDEIAALRERWHWPVSADPRDHTRRGLYILVRRNFRLPLFEAFDSPVNAVSCPQRAVTTVAPQALWFLNNETAMRQARELAARLLREVADDPAGQVERAWWLALGRPPSTTESDEALALLTELSGADGGETALDTPTALSKLCLALFNLSEFVYVD